VNCANVPSKKAEDADLVDWLRRSEFTGRDYDLFATELARYGYAVTVAWIRQGAIFGNSRERGAGLPTVARPWPDSGWPLNVNRHPHASCYAQTPGTPLRQRSAQPRVFVQAWHTLPRLRRRAERGPVSRHTRNDLGQQVLRAGDVVGRRR
jgi:hypothetical protein